MDNPLSINEISELIRDIPDFPKPGIIFKDIVPLLNHAHGLSSITHHFCERYREKEINQIVGIESRGFIFGAPLAQALNIPFNIIRKPGKLPAATVKETYELEYGTDTIEIHQDSVQKGDKVLLIDDLLATGGTAKAAVNLLTQLGGEVVECCFLVELSFLKGAESLSAPSFSLIQYD